MAAQALPSQNPEKLPTQGGPFYQLLRSVFGDPCFGLLVLYLGLATPIPFLVGLSVMVLSIVLVGAFEFIMMKKGES